MKRDKEISEVIFTGGMDQDTDWHKLPKGRYPYAQNVEVAKGVVGDVLVAMRGQLGGDYLYKAVPGYPGGATLRNAGTIRDEEFSRIVFFLVDIATNEHHIMLWTRDGGITRLLKTDKLNFSSQWYIHSGAIVDGVVYFSDGVYLDDGIDPVENQSGIPVGNPPRGINIERFRTGKNLKYELLFNEACFNNTGITFSYTLLDYDNNVVTSSTPFYTISTVDTQDLLIQAIATALGGIFTVEAFDVNTSTYPARKIIFQYDTDVDIRVRINVTGPGGPQVTVNELNYFPPPETTSDFDEMITLIKPAPPFPPTVTFEQDATVTTTNLYGKAYQFRHRYVFVDGEKSAWGPASLVPTNFVRGPNLLGLLPDGAVNSRDYNKIVISFNANEKYLSSPWRTFVRKVEIAVRSSETDPWSFIDSYDLSDYFIDDIHMDFYGLETRFVLPSDETADSGVQALKNFDFVPRISLGLESVYDDQGNALLVAGGGLYDYDVPTLRGGVEVRTDLTLTPLTGLETSQVSFLKGMKRGGRYRVGLIGKDNWGRQGSVMPYIFPDGSNEFRVPFSKFDVGDTVINVIPTLKVTVENTFPNWMEYWQVVISENLNQDIYWQTPIMDVRRFGLIDDGEGNLELQELSNGKYMGWGILADQLKTLPENLVLFDYGQTAQGQFIPADGDKFQVMWWTTEGTIAAGGPDRDDIEKYNYDIVGYGYHRPSDTDQDVVYIFLEAANLPTFDLQPQDGGEDVEITYNVEIYRPITGTIEDLYYEIGPVQRVSDGITELTLENYGDTYFRYSTVYVPTAGLQSGDLLLQVLRYGENSSLHYQNRDNLGDFGREVVYDPEYRERFLPNFIRHSDSNTPESSVRRLSAFAGGNSFSLTSRWGPINKLVMNQNVLLAIMSHKTQPIYVAKDRLLTLEGSLVGRTSRIFNVADEVMMDLGTTYPSSVCYDQGRTYAFDVIKGKYWRYTTGGGQIAISDNGMINHFRGIARSEVGGISFPLSGFDFATNQLFVFDGLYTTIFLEDGSNSRWVGFVDIPTPRGFCRAGNDFLMWNEEEPFRFDEAGAGFRTELMGTQKYPIVDCIVNAPEHLVKNFDALEIHSSHRWFSPEIEIWRSENYPNGMLSQLIDNKWTYYEGIGRAAFLRDQTDPSFGEIIDPDERTVTALLQGRELKGKSIRIRLTCEEQATRGQLFFEKIQRLYGVYVYWQPSLATVIS